MLCWVCLHGRRGSVLELLSGCFDGRTKCSIHDVQYSILANRRGVPRTFRSGYCCSNIKHAEDMFLGSNPHSGKYCLLDNVWFYGLVARSSMGAVKELWARSIISSFVIFFLPLGVVPVVFIH